MEIATQEAEAAARKEEAVAAMGNETERAAAAEDVRQWYVVPRTALFFLLSWRDPVT